MAYEVKLEVFQGPIDLLLHLITKQRVDIYEVSIATITEEYLSAIAGIDSLDLDTATGFLVVAATLLELKSLRLLPSRSPADEGDVGLLEERDLLLARLVECATFRDAGAFLSARLHEGGSYVGRSVTLEPHLVAAAPDLLARTSLQDIARAAAQALAPKPRAEVDMSHVAPITVSVGDAIREVATALQASGRVFFDKLCGRRPRRIDVVVRFLALLELFKAGAIELNQARLFGDIEAIWTGEADTAEVLSDAEEYEVQTVRFAAEAGAAARIGESGAGSER